MSWQAKVRFVGAICLAGVLLWLGSRDGVLEAPFLAARTATAEVTTQLLRLLGMDAMRQATAVFHPTGFGIDITRGCTGFVGVVLLGSAVAGYPAERAIRLTGLALCPLAFVTVNFARLAHLYYMGVHEQPLFHTAHTVFWQLGMLVGGVTVWLLCKWWGDKKTGDREIRSPVE